MLNGKFYTGLPPKMVERQGANSRSCNRQESHFFWPDDTQMDSAVETRVKRRNSLQLEKPRQLDRSSSVQVDGNTVDTRQMFHKEFAKSSINFYDNLQQTPETNARPRLLRGLRREVTPKLTEVKPYMEEKSSELAPLDKQDRRQQAYSSKIQFYDYVNEATQNNARRPKMDMNDKREMELNSKNSPKLQVKRNVRSLSMEMESESPPIITKKPLNDQLVTERRRPVLLLPKKILKHQEPKRGSDYVDYNTMDNEMRKLRLRSPAPQKKHVTYNEEADEYAYFKDGEGLADDRYDHQPSFHREQQQQQYSSTPNMSTGSRSSQRPPYGETSRGSAREIQSLNNNKNLHYNHYNNNNNTRKILPKLPETEPRTRYSDDTQVTTPTLEVEAASPPSDPRKHLRSSLCFNGDALVVGGQAATSTTATSLARHSSAGQRISVGLPD
ncbi:uncharacterized protein [Drosophila tropicalis]|uniref:uncharacterized protein n=1 Tax=Drosophila tropicalis TaxID=46794 RepID=UPI0035ABC3CA